jgi:hypothetical protein
MMVWVLTFTDRRKHETVSKDKALIFCSARHWRAFGYSVRVDRMSLAKVGLFDPWAEPVTLRRSGPFMSKRTLRSVKRWLANRATEKKRSKDV